MYLMSSNKLCSKQIIIAAQESKAKTQEIISVFIWWEMCACNALDKKKKMKKWEKSDHSKIFITYN
jgi:hypothetical protein